MSTGDRRNGAAADEMPQDALLARLYREQTDSAAQPPAALDARILAAARAAAASRPAPRALPWWRRFAVPISVAAVLVVSATLTLMVHEERAKLEAPPPAAAPAPVPAPSTQAADTAAVRPQEAAPAGQPGAASPLPRAATPQPQTRRQDVAREAKPAPEPRAEPPAAAVAPPPAAAPAAPLGEAFPATRPAPQSEGRILSAPMREAPSASPSAREEEGAGGVVSPAMRAKTREALAPGSAAKSEAADAAQRAPEDWLRQIRELRRAGREAEWRAELARFRARYPDYALPADLRE